MVLHQWIRLRPLLFSSSSSGRYYLANINSGHLYAILISPHAINYCSPEKTASAFREICIDVEGKWGFITAVLKLRMDAERRFLS